MGYYHKLYWALEVCIDDTIILNINKAYVRVNTKICSIEVSKRLATKQNSHVS